MKFMNLSQVTIPAKYMEMLASAQRNIPAITESPTHPHTTYEQSDLNLHEKTLCNINLMSSHRQAMASDPTIYSNKYDDGICDCLAVTVRVNDNKK